MIFNSIEFAIFLPIVFGIYWMLQGNIKRQNLFLLVASYFFYGWWDWRFLFLIALSSGVDFIAGQQIYREQDRKKQKYWLWLSLAVNLGMLGFFKYSNFFLENFIEAFTMFGYNFQVERLNIVLPVGISFYTFQTLSYTIDIYKGIMKPAKDPIPFFAYVSFFPQLVAGPIERAFDLLPQINNTRSFNYTKAVDGMRQILWGLFKKVVIADNCAPYVHDIFSGAENLHSPILFVGMTLFTVQLYCDFSGYSDIAIGVARLFGFKLSKNFDYPQFSKSIPEFWSRWHITMTSWFRDYIYMPLIRWKRKGAFKIINIFILFLVIGVWHGAKWTFVLFGLINALLYITQNALSKRNSRFSPEGKGVFLQKAYALIRILFNCFTLILIITFFRADNITHAFHYLGRFFNPENWFVFDIIPRHYLSLRFVFLTSMFFLIYEYFQQGTEYGLELKNKLYRNAGIRWTTYTLMIIFIYYYRGVELDFIYFQF
ncbi:MAG TPA: MBOAT family O-acyltransferase [Saprospiraceae bacterium]|nr:MBOAT family O-acyltransferase [Saprospiraceae bacterium]